MNKLLSLLLTAVLAGIGAPSLAQITLYEHNDFQGRQLRLQQPVEDLRELRFHDRASSVVVERGWWELCTDARFSGTCVVLRPGRHAALGDLNLNDKLSSLRPLHGGRAERERRWGPREIVVYEHSDFRGRSITLSDDTQNFQDLDFNDRASSVLVVGGEWELCEHGHYRGRCVRLGPGRHRSLVELGFNDVASSARRVYSPYRLEDEPHRPRPIGPAHEPH